MHRCQRLVAALPLFAGALLPAQSQSVLDLQKDYHVGAFGPTIEPQSGAFTAFAGVGSLSLTAGGGLTGTFDGTQVTALGATFAPNQPIAADYLVALDGQMFWDFDPTNPGTDVIALWIDRDGSVVHSARRELGDDSQSLIAIEKGSSMSTASLQGTCHHVDQTMRFVAGAPQTIDTWGTITFDGAGTASFSKTVLTAGVGGTTVQSQTGTMPYSVAADGTLDLNGAIGGVRADGQLWFAVLGDTSSGGSVRMTIGVKTGASYDHGDLTGRYSLSTNSTELGVGPSLPRTSTNYGEISVATLSPTAGTFAAGGVSVEGTPAGATLSPFVVAGTTSLTGSGVLTLASSSVTLEVGVSADAQYFVGRALGQSGNFAFGMRQCAAASSYGTGTAGTGGVAPELGMKTFPWLGNAAFQLNVTRALGGSIGLVALSGGDAPGLPALGGQVWIDPLAIGYTAAVLCQGSPGAAGAGFQTTGLPIPATASLAGFALFAQAVILDAGAPAGFAMSNGLRVELCD